MQLQFFFSLILSLVVLECLAVHKNYNARQTGCLEDANRTPPKKYFFFTFAFVNLFFLVYLSTFFLNIVHKKIADDTTERLVCEPKRCIWPDMSPVGISSFVWASLFFLPFKATFLMKSALLWPVSRVGATQMPEGQLPREGKNTTENRTALPSD